ncbi:MAG TPA: response regulator [Nitrososphaeraceae archaeon]|jgi:two-component system, OmpR family, response regulator ChvI|nr:response regulator [Nitrososphaeraceae archaeon]
MMKRKRILIVDDDRDILTTYKKGLEQSGLFEVDTFDDPEEALSNFKSGLYDCLIIDIRLPKMDGFELYDRMKAIDDKVKICFITAYEVNYRALRQVFPEPILECFIQKPIEIGKLVERIKSELEQ